MSDAYEAMKRLRDERDRSFAGQASDLAAQRSRDLKVQAERIAELLQILKLEQVAGTPLYRTVNLKTRGNDSSWEYSFTGMYGWSVGIIGESYSELPEYGLVTDSGDIYTFSHTRTAGKNPPFGGKTKVKGLTNGPGYAIGETAYDGLLPTRGKNGPVLSFIDADELSKFYLRVVESNRK